MYTTGYKRQFKELLENRALKIVTEKSKKRNLRKKKYIY